MKGFPLLGYVPKLDYDGIAEFWMPDLSCFAKACEDPYYKEVVKPDEDELFVMETSTWTVGWTEVYIQDGKILETSGEA